MALALHALFPNEMNDVVQGIESGKSTKKKEFNKVKVAELTEWGEGGSMRAKFGSLSSWNAIPSASIFDMDQTID